MTALGARHIFANMDPNPGAMIPGRLPKNTILRESCTRCERTITKKGAYLADIRGLGRTL